ncbi:MAG: hypothetical protein LC687_02935 [Actinobacteria bacterium]|nr:hypothetical protein [Actinomycetota bacterium]
MKRVCIIVALLIAISSPLYASDVNNPTFYSYSGGSFTNRLVNMSFGFFRKLNNYQLEAYNQAVSHAVMMADNGERVQWYQGDASGFAMPVYTYPTHSGGYCRQIHIQVIAYNMEKTLSETACLNASNNNWQWVRR